MTRLFIFVTIFVDLIGYGIVIPLLPLYVQQQASGGSIVGALGALYALVQALGGPFLVGLSDRFGRRPILFLCLAGTATAYLILSQATTIWLVCLAIILDGITGANMSTAQAYIADTTPPEQRAQRFGLVSAAYGLGLMAGPIIGGVLSRYGLALPALAAAGLAIVNLLLGIAILPESLPTERRIHARVLQFNPFAHIGTSLQRADLRRLLLTVLLINISFSGLQSNFPIFSLQRFGWDAQANAFFYAFVGVIAVTTQAFILGQARRLMDERYLALLGIALMAVGLALVGIAPQAWMLYPLVTILALGSNISIPCLTAILSVRIGEQGQGQLMGSLQSVLNIAMVMGPLLAGLSFDYVGAWAPYVLGSLVALLALWVVAFIPAHK